MPRKRKICIVEDCNTLYRQRDCCQKHFTKWFREGKIKTKDGQVLKYDYDNPTSSAALIEYFGVKIRKKEDGLKLTRDNYVKVSYQSSFYSFEVYEKSPGVNSYRKFRETFDDSYIVHHTERCLANYDLNLKYFNSLDKEKFNKDLDKTISKINKTRIVSKAEEEMIRGDKKSFNKFSKGWTKNELNEFFNEKYWFEEVTDLNLLREVSGIYIMVLDEYAQIYIGKSDNMKTRIMGHWSKTKEFDRLIFGGVNNSVLSIDSFRAFDTTRIYVYPTNKSEIAEDMIINQFDHRYILNRTVGGSLEGGLIEAIANRKTRLLTE